MSWTPPNGHISQSGIPVRNSKVESKATYIFECHTRIASPEEIERLCSKPDRHKPRKAISPLVATTFSDVRKYGEKAKKKAITNRLKNVIAKAKQQERLVHVAKAMYRLQQYCDSMDDCPKCSLSYGIGRANCGIITSKIPAEWGITVEDIKRLERNCKGDHND